MRLNGHIASAGCSESFSEYESQATRSQCMGLGQHGLSTLCPVAILLPNLYEVDAETGNAKYGLLGIDWV